MLKNIFLKQRGFTLPEIAVVLMISGASLIAATQFTSIYTDNVKYNTTIENLEMVYDALEEYAALNGYYPCPANPAASPGDSDYGISKCRDESDASFDEDNCNIVPSGISCVTTGSRDTDDNGYNDIVVIGAIPIYTIIDGVSDTPVRAYHRLDGYGNLISYAVTEKLTETYSSELNLSTPFNPLMGSISVLDENLNSLMDPSGEAQFVIFSHGMDSVGGYSKRGKVIENCFVPSVPNGPDDTWPTEGLYGGNGKIETENCDNNDAYFVKGILSIANNSNYFDDFLYYKGRGLESLWKRSIASPAGESYIYNTNMGNVGVGTAEPDTKLHIKGDLSAELNLISSNYCGPDGTPDCDLDTDPYCGKECLNPYFLASDIGTKARCTDGQVAYAVGENKIECRDVDWTIPNKTCQDIGGSPSFLQGISNLGNIYCCIEDGSVCEKQCDTDPCPCQIECACIPGSVCHCTENCP